MTDADYIRMTNSTNHIHTPRRGWMFWGGVVVVGVMMGVWVVW